MWVQLRDLVATIPPAKPETHAIPAPEILATPVRATINLEGQASPLGMTPESPEKSVELLPSPKLPSPMTLVEKSMTGLTENQQESIGPAC